MQSLIEANYFHSVIEENVQAKIMDTSITFIVDRPLNQPSLNQNPNAEIESN